MGVRFETHKAPVYWASYLINGDPSSLSDQEVEMADAWLEWTGGIGVADCAEEAHFSWAYDFYADPWGRFPDTAKGGDLIEYTVMYETREEEVREQGELL